MASTLPSLVHLYMKCLLGRFDPMVNSTWSVPGQPVMATHDDGSDSRYPK